MGPSTTTELQICPRSAIFDKIAVVNYIKKVDGSDVFDEHISYNVLKIKEL